jgi:hypothetical protein
MSLLDRKYHQRGAADSLLHRGISALSPRRFTSGLGHSRPGLAGRRSSHVRYAPKATVGHQNAIGRDVPTRDVSSLPNAPITGASLIAEVSAERGEVPLY